MNTQNIDGMGQEWALVAVGLCFEQIVTLDASPGALAEIEASDDDLLRMALHDQISGPGRSQCLYVWRGRLEPIQTLMQPAARTHRWVGAVAPALPEEAEPLGSDTAVVRDAPQRVLFARGVNGQVAVIWATHEGTDSAMDELLTHEFDYMADVLEEHPASMGVADEPGLWIWEGSITPDSPVARWSGWVRQATTSEVLDACGNLVGPWRR